MRDVYQHAVNLLNVLTFWMVVYLFIHVWRAK